MQAEEISFDKLIIYLKSYRKWALIIAVVTINHVIGFISSLFYTPNNPIDTKFSFFYKVIVVVIIAPIVETLIFQTLIISVINKYTKNQLLAVLTSAIAFGLSHNFSVAYITNTIIAGIFLGILYIVCKKQFATIHVIIAHSLYNFIGIIVHEIIISHFK